MMDWQNDPPDDDLPQHDGQQEGPLPPVHDSPLTIGKVMDIFPKLKNG